MATNPLNRISGGRVRQRYYEVAPAGVNGVNCAVSAELDPSGGNRRSRSRRANNPHMVGSSPSGQVVAPMIPPILSGGGNSPAPASSAISARATSPIGRLSNTPAMTVENAGVSRSVLSSSAGIAPPSLRSRAGAGSGGFVSSTVGVPAASAVRSDHSSQAGSRLWPVGEALVGAGAVGAIATGVGRRFAVDDSDLALPDPAQPREGSGDSSHYHHIEGMGGDVTSQPDNRAGSSGMWSSDQDSLGQYGYPYGADASLAGFPTPSVGAGEVVATTGLVADTGRHVGAGADTGHSFRGGFGGVGSGGIPVHGRATSAGGATNGSAGLHVPITDMEQSQSQWGKIAGQMGAINQALTGLAPVGGFSADLVDATTRHRDLMVKWSQGAAHCFSDIADNLSGTARHYRTHEEQTQSMITRVLKDVR